MNRVYITHILIYLKMINGNFSEDSLVQYQNLLVAFLQSESDDSSEGTYDFTRCVRPDGSFYGTDGDCQEPNRLAPRSPGDALSTAGRSAYVAGGGNAASMKGKSIDEVIAQGKRNLERMDQGRGRQGTSASVSGQPRTAPRQGPVSGLSTADRSAYVAGGGNAAGMKGKSVDEVIAQGRRNLDRMDQGRGRQSSNAPTPTQRPGTTGSGSTRRPSSGSAGRRLSTAERSAYAAGGGNAAGMKGKSVDEVIAQGRRNLDRMDQGRGRK